MELTKTPFGLYEISFGVNQKCSINEEDARVLRDLLVKVLSADPGSVISPDVPATTIPPVIEPPFTPTPTTPYGTCGDTVRNPDGRYNETKPYASGPTVEGHTESKPSSFDKPKDVPFGTVSTEYIPVKPFDNTTPDPSGVSYKDKSYNKRKNK